MTQENKKLSRRDAIKLLGAAVPAVGMVKLPSKWSKPVLAGGYLPVHAQTSCIGLYLEVLSIDGLMGLTINGGVPAPDDIAGDGSAGSFATWYCQPACLFITLFIASGTTGQVQLTTPTDQFILDFSEPNPVFHDVLIDLGTGEHAEDGASTTNCLYPQIAFAPSERTSDQNNLWK